MVMRKKKKTAVNNEKKEKYFYQVNKKIAFFGKGIGIDKIII